MGPQRGETWHSWLGSLRHAARLKTNWSGQWLRYLHVAAMVSNCEYTVSNKEGLPCHCHDCGRLWEQCPHALYFVGATAPTAPQFHHLWWAHNNSLWFMAIWLFYVDALPRWEWWPRLSWYCLGYLQFYRLHRHSTLVVLVLYSCAVNINLGLIFTWSSTHSYRIASDSSLIHTLMVHLIVRKKI